ncbi:MAG: ATP-dependent DNA helicase RecG [Clostridia bacterium]|nr:ATP-dependent DNA helicase RecG [Clostridia bacterium]
MENLRNTPIKALHGVGAVKAKAYAKLGVETLYDLLFHFPRAYENRGDIKKLGECDGTSKNAVILTIATAPKIARIRRGMNLLKFRAYDESGMCEITYFNQDYLKTSFPMGVSFRFYGKVERVGNKFSMSSPSHELYAESLKLPDFTPIYPLSEGLSQKQIVQNTALVLEMAKSGLDDYLPYEIRTENKLCTLSTALKEIHSPTSYAALANAKKRLIFDEFFLFSIGINTAAKIQKETGAPIFKDTDISELLSLLPYSLTNAQKRTVADIASDVSKDVPMGRIVIGDVGCGKTVCAAAAMLMAVRNGYQAALMAPTEILACQHQNDLAPIFEKMGIRCELLVGALTPAKKRKIHECLSRKEIDIVIGTQALLSEGVEFASLGLVVVDEQHRFGVEQRAILSKKGEKPHLLVMSATPIPRSMALAMYGNLDKTIIDEIPPGRQRVDTFLVNESYRSRLDTFIKKQVEDGGQVYIVCPAVEETEEDSGEVSLYDISEYQMLESKPPLKAAIQYSEEISLKFPEFKTAFVHGKLKSSEKEKIMSAFVSGETKILVSTTVIEVGVNVPNACLMIVENAERFGLSQLHQLRGRVGRGTRKS